MLGQRGDYNYHWGHMRVVCQFVRNTTTNNIFIAGATLVLGFDVVKYF